MLKIKISKIIILVLFIFTNTSCISNVSDKSTLVDVSQDEICKKQNNKVVYPMKIKHNHGITLIRKKPQRVAVYGVDKHDEDIVMALNIVPVAISGVNERKDIPKWQMEKLQELNAPKPAILNYYIEWYPKAVQPYKPDVILISDSELNGDENYKKLSKIAPVIPFPDAARRYTDTEIRNNRIAMECKIRLYSKVLGVPNRGERFMTKIYSTIKSSLKMHKNLKDKRIILVNFYLKPVAINYSTKEDARAGFLYEIGLPEPSFVKIGLTNTTISAKDAISAFSDIDVFIPYNRSGLNADKIASLQADQYAGQIPAIKTGRIVQFDQNNEDYSLISYAYPLSIPWGLNTYLDMIEKTSQK